MAERGEYLGEEGLGLVDDKGRVAIPNSLRTILAANAPRSDGKDGGTIIIGAHPAQRCLIAYDEGYLKPHHARLDARESAREAASGQVDYNIKRRGGSGEAVPFDGSGRFIMPGWPRRYARIFGHAFFWGSIDWIEIWNPKALIEDMSVDEIMREACEYHCEVKGVTL